MTTGSEGRNGGGVETGRSGAALVAALLFLLVFTALAEGALLLARREWESSAAFRRLAQAEAGARLALSLAGTALQGGSPLFLGPRPVGGGGEVASAESQDGIRLRAALRWLDREFFLVEGEGRVAGAAGLRRVGLVGWSLDALTRVAEFRGVAEVRGGSATGPEAAVTGAALLECPQGWPAGSCSGLRPALDSIFGVGSLPLTAPLASVPGADGDSLPGPPGLGLLPGARIQELAHRPPLGPPGRPDGWPLLTGGDRGCPPGAEPVLEAVPGSVEVRGARICGLWVVDGSLRLAEGAVFQGLLLLGGDLILEPGATFEGLVRSEGRLIVGGEGVFRGSAIAALHALQAATELTLPLLFPQSPILEGL